MAAQKLSGSGKRRTAPKASLSWTEDMRITLDILQKYDSLTWNHRSQAFHFIWSQHIRQCGLETVPHTTLRSQCSNAERKKSKAWLKIAAGPQTSGERAAWQRLRDRVEVALESLDTAPKALPVLRKGIRSQPNRHTMPTTPATAGFASPVALPHSALAASASPNTARDTPLSRRPAIAIWNPMSDIGDDDERQETETGGDPQPAAKRQKTTHTQVEVQVQIQRRPSASTRTEGGSPRTPKKVRRDLPKSPYHRPGDVLRGFQAPQLTVEEHARTEEELVPVPDHLAHPPLSSLLFRYYVPRPDELGRGHNGESGFIAGRFAHSVRMYMPPPLHPEWVDIYNHIDSVRAPSPFISVSNALFWISRLAIKEQNKEGSFSAGARIAIIDAEQLDKRAVFHAAPLHAETKKKFVYHEGAWHYHGTHEFLVWREIPAHAIIKTIQVKDLVRLVYRMPAINEALAFPILASNTGYKTNILPMLRARKLSLAPAVVEGIAAVVDFLGLNHLQMGGISHIVSDLVQGWGLYLDSSVDWAALADIFDQALLQRAGDSRRQLSLRNNKARLGFLDGLRWGCSKHFNARHDARLVRLMQKQAQRVGLDNPVKVLIDELDAAKVRLRLLANTSTSTGLVQNSETPTNKRKRILLETAQAQWQQDDEDTIVVARPRCQRAVEATDKDEEGEEDEESEDVFEIGEDGLVV